MQKHPLSKPDFDTEAEQALARLDIDPEDLELAPKITDTLCACFGVERFPRQQVFNYLAASPMPSAIRLLEKYREIPERDRIRVPIEAICIAAGVSPLEILGAITIAAKNMKGQESALKAILAHPEVVGHTITTASLLGPAGDASRKMIHEAVGFLPTRNGQSIAINVGAPPKDDGDGPDDEEQKWDEAFPLISGKLEQWSERRRSLADGK